MRTITALLLLTASLVLFGCEEGKKATPQDASALRQAADQARSPSAAEPAQLNSKQTLTDALVTAIGGRKQQVSQVSLEEATAV